MSRLVVKICGIVRPEDGIAAIRAGADRLGFIRWPGSKRFRPIDECAAALAEIRAGAGRPFAAVGVFVDATPEEIEREVAIAGFDMVQLHGEESPEILARLSRPAIKAIKIGPDREPAAIQAARWPDVELLADAADPAHGGTGKTYDLSELEDLVRHRRVLVAGGMRPETVGEAVRRLRPFGVDVSSGVEVSPGVKDAAKIEAFVAAARERESRIANSELRIANGE